MVANVNRVSGYCEPGLSFTYIFSLIPNSHPVRQESHSPHITGEKTEAPRSKETLNFYKFKLMEVALSPVLVTALCQLLFQIIA